MHSQPSTVAPVLSDEFLEPYKTKPVPWGFGDLSQIVAKRTYSRTKDDGSLEEWWEVLRRVVEGAQKIGAGYSVEEAQRFYDLMFNLKCLLSGRMLWQLGTTTVDRFGGNSLLSCWFVNINAIDSFCFLFENLMLGGGVGFSVKREHVHELPKIKKGVRIISQKTNDADFIVPDSRQGWVSLLRKVLNSYFNTGESFTYSTILVRGAGAPIKGFGGKASGPEVLEQGIGWICEVLSKREGKKIRSIDALDVCNILAYIVVSGNTRRSATISIGDPDDYLFMKAKRWDTGNIPNWRAMSNNSLYVDSYDHIMPLVWEGYNGNGEPYGFINLDLAKRCGRLIDGPMAYSDLYPVKEDNCEGMNPCGELPCASAECCCLSDLFLNNISSPDELFECARLVYKTQKAICSLPFLHKETEKIVRQNFRIGIGVTGICQSLEKIDWLDECYRKIRAFDVDWSKQKGIPRSIKLTTVKPAGTLSLLGGSTSGVHPGFAQYYIRRVRMAADDALVPTCRDMGYKVEHVLNFDGTKDFRTVTVEFPCKLDNTILAKDMTAVQQLELVKRIQTYWSDNSVSVTVYYRQEELSAIQEWMKENYAASLKSVSFLLHKDHNFAQPPLEEIDQKRYEKMVATIKPLSQINHHNDELPDSFECSTGACPIK